MITNFLALVLHLLAPFSAVVEHPHYPKAIVVGGAAGNVKVMYFTVPFNEKHFADLEPGFDWHLGFSMVETEVALRAGDAEIPAGKYALNARLGSDGESWDLVLKSKDEEYVLGGADYESGDNEHLEMVAIHRGFATVKPRSTEPQGGVEFDLRVGFGGLHRQVTIAEVFEAEKD